MFGFLKKKLLRQEEENLKAAAHQELGKAHVLAEQAEITRNELKKALDEAQRIIEKRKVSTE